MARPLDEKLEPIEENALDYLGQTFEFDDNHIVMQNRLLEYLQDIRERVMKEFDIDHEKWSGILAEHVDKAINTVKPSSFGF